MEKATNKFHGTFCPFLRGRPNGRQKKRWPATIAVGPNVIRRMRHESISTAVGTGEIPFLDQYGMHKVSRVWRNPLSCGNKHSLIPWSPL
jgi:hypothetical protein